MGANDTSEMLAAAQAQSVLDEREITRLRTERDALSLELLAASHAWARILHVIDDHPETIPTDVLRRALLEPPAETP